MNEMKAFLREILENRKACILVAIIGQKLATGHLSIILTWWEVHIGNGGTEDRKRETG